MRECSRRSQKRLKSPSAKCWQASSPKTSKKASRTSSENARQPSPADEQNYTSLSRRDFRHDFPPHRGFDSPWPQLCHWHFVDEHETNSLEGTGNVGTLGGIQIILAWFDPLTSPAWNGGSLETSNSGRGSMRVLLYREQCSRATTRRGLLGERGHGDAGLERRGWLPAADNGRRSIPRL